MNLWYYGRADQQFGPIDEFTLRGKIASGEVPGDSLVWRDGMSDWQPLASVAELQGPAPQGIYAPPATNPAYQGGGYPYAPPPTCGLAIASLVCGIVSVLMCYFGALAGIPAVICGHMALSRIAAAQNAMGGRGMAIAGLVTGYIGLGITVLFVGFILVGLVSSGGTF
jgi:hypothetical protein